MARRRKNDDLIWIRALAGIIIGVACLSILNPDFRHALLVVGITVFVLAVVLLLGFLAFKTTTGKGKGSSTGGYTLASKPEVSPIDRLREIDWYQFEKSVAYVYEQHGFHVTRKGGANPDGGIDMVIEKNGQRFAVQCKQWKTWDVGVKAIREFLGALTDSKIEKGIFITLNGYTGDAKQLAEKHGIEIINETGLRRMVEGLDLRNPKIQEIFDDTRKICPKCERPLVLRTARKGPNAGGQFWGCTGYPLGCTFKMSV